MDGFIKVERVKAICKNSLQQSTVLVSLIFELKLSYQLFLSISDTEKILQQYSKLFNHRKLQSPIQPLYECPKNLFVLLTIVC